MMNKNFFNLSIYLITFHLHMSTLHPALLLQPYGHQSILDPEAYVSP